MKYLSSSLKVALAAFIISFGVISLNTSPAVANEDKKAEPVLGEPRHIPLDPVTVSVFRDARVRGILSVDVSLELADADDREDVEKILPRLRNQFIMVLTQLAANRVDVVRPIDVDGIAAVLQGAADRTLGGKVARVLVEGATIRRL